MNSLRPFRVARRLAPLLAFVLLPVGLGACNPSNAKPAGPNPAREIRDLITALTPPPATSVPVVKSEFYANRKRTLERMRQTSEAHGLEALRVYKDEHPALPEVRAGLLDIAAHTAPKATEPLLVELTITFGEDLYVRSSATDLLGECAPEKAIEVLEPVLRERYDGRTYPPEERLLGAWLKANEQLGRDPVPLLSLVATDLKRPMDVRHSATKALGKHPSEQGRQALENILVESSGNGYIRRLALQSLRESLPQKEFCDLALRTQEHESDTEFIVFIQSALDARCR